MSAVIGPVGVDHLDFGDGRNAAFALEVFLADFDVAFVHGQTAVCDELFQRRFIHIVESFDGFDRLRKLVFNAQGLRHVEGCLAHLDRIDNEADDLLQFLRSHRAADQIDFGARHQRTLLLGDDLDALGSGVRSLIVLSRQRFDCKDRIAHFGECRLIPNKPVNIVDLRF